MVQIAFLTLFLGMVSGKQPVELAVSGPVAAVALELDGVPVGGMTAAPWKWQVSFGSDLLPHELVARALGEDGVELARVRQWVNLPRPPAEVSLALEGGGEAGPTAVRLGWESLVAGKPTRMSLTLDGEPLAVGRDGRAALPPRVPHEPHLLSAEVDLGSGIVARRDVVFGGAGGGEAFGELTAVPVRVRGGELPPVERMQGWFTAGGAPLRVVAVEKEGGQIVVVRDARARQILGHSVGIGRTPRDRPSTAIGSQDRVRFLSPRPRSGAGSTSADLFDFSRDFTYRDGGLHFLLGQLRASGESTEGQRLADAVAVAGLQALAGNRPRAVLLVLGPQPVDASRYSPAAVRRYLEALRVPLHVWSLVPPASSSAAAAWGAAGDVANLDHLDVVVKRLREDLASQRMVFLEGLHLPQSIALSPAAVGVELP